MYENTRPGLRPLVRAADQDRVGALADELDALEIVDDLRHREREHALARERVRGRARGRLQLLVLELDAERAQRLRERARVRVVELVTKRRRWPASRSRRTASAAPGSALPDTCRTPSTSSRIAAMERESIRVTRSVAVPLSEIELRTSRSSGPGGQHANTSETRVEARFDVEGSTALTPAQKRRVVAKAGPVLRAVAQDERSQLRNRKLAIERLAALLREALHVERRRVPTRPTSGSVERRLQEKKRRGELKRGRRADDD